MPRGRFDQHSSAVSASVVLVQLHVPGQLNTLTQIDPVAAYLVPGRAVGVAELPHSALITQGLMRMGAPL